MGGGEFQEVPSLLAEAGGERVGVASGVLVDDADLMPVEQPQLRLPGRVEGQRPRVTDPEPFPSGAPLGRSCSIRRWLANRFARPRWETTTPLGVPVDPEVKMT